MSRFVDSHDAVQIARRPGDPGLYLSLAPMDGVTDWVHRALASELGGVSACVTEFVRVTDRAPPRRVFLRTCPELAAGGTTREGVPVFVQILGGDPRAMAEAGALAASLGAPGIDLNFGCPAKRVNNHDGGASILRCPERAEQITRAVRDAVPPSVPVSAKVRLGWDDTQHAVEIAEAVARGGASWLTIHGRTKSQMYAPPVDYSAIGRARRAVTIPVIANGDIACPESFARCRSESGAASFMIGRGALARPYLFRALRGEPMERLETLEAYCAVLRRYDALMAEGGFHDGQRLCRLKQWLSLARTFASELVPLFDRVKRAATIDHALACLSSRSASLRAPMHDADATC